MPRISARKPPVVPIRARVVDTPQLPKRKRGRPPKSVATGMAVKTFNKKCSEFDSALLPVVRSMFSFLLSVFVSQLEYLKSDPGLLSSWHLAKLDRKSRTLVQVGENAISLVNSYPATAAERTTLRQYLSQSMLFLLVLN